MGKKKQLALNFNDELYEKIVQIVGQGYTSNRAVATKLGVLPSTWINYRYPPKSYENYQERLVIKNGIDKAFKEGMLIFRENIKAESQVSLLKLIKGYTATETKEKYEGVGSTMTLVEKTKTKKHFSPNSTAVIFGLVNTDENYKSINNPNQSNQDIENNTSNIIEIGFDENKENEYWEDWEDVTHYEEV